MLKQLIRLPTTLIALLGVLTSTAAAAQWNQGDPSNEEQYTLEQINRFRADPIAYVKHYMALKNSDALVAGIMDGRRDDVFLNYCTSVYGTVDDVGGGTARYPLVLYPPITQVARNRREVTESQIRNGFPVYSGGADQWRDAVSATPQISDILSYVPTLPSAYILTFDEAPQTAPNATGGSAAITTLVNRPAMTIWSVVNFYSPSTLTAREWLLTCSQFVKIMMRPYITQERSSGIRGKQRMAGIDIGRRNNAPGVKLINMVQMDNESFTTNDLPYGNVDTVFITGVAFQDNNNNEEYDVGEGLKNVAVTISGSTWSAVTATAGGYAIPVRANSGSVQVTAVSPDGKINKTMTVNVGPDSVKADFTLTADKPAQVQVPASEGTTQIINLSTRGIAAAGSDALIGGFVISGTGQKTLLIRAMSNSLKALGLTGVLGKPALTIFDSTGKTIIKKSTQETYIEVQNGGLVKTTAALVGAFAFDIVNTGEGGSRGDAAVVVTLAPAAYTVSIAPATDTGNVSNRERGIVLLEIYDVSQTDGSRLINVATRGTVDFGDSQMIVGFSLKGNGNRRVLVRGIGPGLGSFRVPGTVEDPNMTLFNSEGSPVFQNDDWFISAQADQVSALSSATGGFALPATSKDSAIVARLGPGNYTAGVTPKSSGGVGLVEVYETL